MKRLYLSNQDVESLISDYRKHNHDEIGDGNVDFEKEFDADGYIVGVQLNIADSNGNIITGYQETFGVFADKFGPVDMQDADGETKYVQRKEDIPQL